MSKNAKDPKNAGKTTRAEGARQVLEADKRRRRRMIGIQVGVVALVVAAVIGGTIFALSSNDDKAAVAGSAPSGVSSDGAYLIGNPEAPVTVQVVEDFQCPVCQQFESVAGAMLDEYAAGDDVNVEYRGIAFLDRASTTDYSSRALNASACVIDSSSADVWKEFHRQMYVEQPAEGGPGLPDSDLIRIASDAGAGDVEACVDDRTWADWVKTTTDAAFDDSVDGTPTVFVNGEKLADFNPATIQTAVDEALAS